MNFKNTKRIVFLFFLFCLILPKVEGKHSPEQAEEWVTIFVHGIISVKPYLNYSNIQMLRNDQIENTVYERGVELTRTNPFFYQYQAMQGFGLQAIDLQAIMPGNATCAFANTYETLQQHVSSAKTTNYYYTFGWSGLLSQTAFRKKAEILYLQIYELLKTFHEQGIFPKVRLIGYSHGGSLTLKVAQAAEKYQDKPITIDELVLFGVPVTPETMYYTHHKVFKKIFHIYSCSDKVVFLDIFSKKRTFSGRIFKESKTFTIPANLIQVELRITVPTKLAQHYILHGTRNFLYLTKRNVRDVSSGHIEHWSFGWTVASYRYDFPLFPFPAANFIPFITQQFDGLIPHKNHVVFEIQPFQEIITIHKKCSYNKTIIPFLNKQEFHELKKEAFKCKPVHLTLEQYDYYIQSALDQAQQERG